MKGKCYYCSREFSKAGILKHIKSCELMRASMGLDKATSAAKVNKFILEISCKYNKDYWLYITTDVNSTLKDLDQFLRDIWLECCGHLSMFRINGENYKSEADEGWIFGKASKNMNIKLKDVLSINDRMQYEYDFGSTTYLEIKVVDMIICANRGKKIEIIARNNEPEIKCSNCGKPAKYFDYENEEYLCDHCLEGYDEDNDMIEEIGYVNSPRVGVCGYEGNREDEVQYLPITKNEKVTDIKNHLDITEVEGDNNKQDFEYDKFESAINNISRTIVNSRFKKELKRWRPIEKNFSLEYHLNRFTKDELLNVARNLHIEKVSGLKKEELKNKILELYEEKAHFIIENMDFERFQFLLRTVREGSCEAYDKDTIMNKIIYFMGRAFLFTGTVNDRGIVIMPEQLQNIILHRDSEEFKKHLEQNEELIKLFWGMCNYYGAVELEVFKELVKKYIDFDISNVNLEAVLEEASDYYGEFNFNGYLGSDIIVDDTYHILSEQDRRSDLEFYPFKKEELLRAAQIDFEDKTKAYNKLYNFFINNFDMNGDEAEDLIFSVEYDIKNDIKFSDVISNLLSNFEISNIEEANIIENEVTKFANNTRQWIIKGYTPEELNPIRVVTQEKIGRNELCPCGSGKKYKKCCGK